MVAATYIGGDCTSKSYLLIKYLWIKLTSKRIFFDGTTSFVVDGGCTVANGRMRSVRCSERQSNHSVSRRLVFPYSRHTLTLWLHMIILELEVFWSTILVLASNCNLPFIASIPSLSFALQVTISTVSEMKQVQVQCKRCIYHTRTFVTCTPWKKKPSILVFFNVEGGRGLLRERIPQLRHAASL